MTNNVAVAFRGLNSNAIWYVLNQGGVWQNPQQIAGASTTDDPALVLCSDICYIFFRGCNSQQGPSPANTLWYTYANVSNGLQAGQWAEPINTGITLIFSPSAVYNPDDKLIYLTFQGVSSNQLYFSSFDGNQNNWGPGKPEMPTIPTPITNCLLNSGPGSIIVPAGSGKGGATTA